LEADAFATTQDWQLPAVHVPAKQACPQRPQLLRSVCVSTHASPQCVVLVPHATTHWYVPPVATQLETPPSGDMQGEPQAPQ
jgi:hypothetical protein